jgi:RNA polymerase II subunit A-like phosphatase
MSKWLITLNKITKRSRRTGNWEYLAKKPREANRCELEGKCCDVMTRDQTHPQQHLDSVHVGMASPTPTNLNLPESLPYPITITSLLVNPGNPVTRGTPLCDYSFAYKLSAQPAPQSPSARDKLRHKGIIYGRWECPIDGIFDKWLIHKGDTILSVEAARMHPVAILMYATHFVLIAPLLTVKRPCREDCPHSTQIHGLCALCGKDMTG